MLQAYVEHVAERAALGIPPLPLTAKQTAELTYRSWVTQSKVFMPGRRCAGR